MYTGAIGKMTLICGRWDWQDKLQDDLALRTVLYKYGTRYLKYISVLLAKSGRFARLFGKFAVTAINIGKVTC